MLFLIDDTSQKKNEILFLSGTVWEFPILLKSKNCFAGKYNKTFLIICRNLFKGTKLMMFLCQIVNLFAVTYNL